MDTSSPTDEPVEDVRLIPRPVSAAGRDSLSSCPRLDASEIDDDSERFLSQHSYLFSADLNSALRGVVQVGCR